MASVFTKEAMARLQPWERRRLMDLQMSPTSSRYGGGGYLPDDCSECGACGAPILGSGWCGACHAEYDRLVAIALVEARGAEEENRG